MLDATDRLAAYLNANPKAVGKVVEFDPEVDRLCKLDFTAANTALSPELIADTNAFTIWIDETLANSRCRYGIGGYMEHRTIYNRSALFDTADEPRRLHLGVDIWASAGTPVYSPLAGIVHSFADNDNFGDYGPTIILQHNLEGLTMYSLYGHLNRESINGLSVGQAVAANQQIATFGNVQENGHWPPHLHFQLMFDIGEAFGDYPGVAKFSEKDVHLCNIPDPALVLSSSGIII
ncbi:peptidoglycan DD-metalloendopeptidase family protein [Mucilaginibacter pallidiroseus]|uniref:Peptidoglycan DD-metalloendopeptidase family protein n=1 Tax=Mucilaginibacter pallidiroseus TaxID=2599295 RepID=A0A563UF79_9SPHI|nr:peptidoglycan DD-metalloendopeptidase family protein [Mucilaginibacter pallidiroseus]TWR29909.1 peptidoglycan DD-metalloendopeptidase family protein [Mucilaginibacter pallidiroseus]